MWRSAGCATSAPLNALNPSHHNATNLFIKYQELPSSTGYKIFLTDLSGRLWQEQLDSEGVIERLKIEASGLEIEPTDFLKLLDQMCQALVDSTCELSSDSRTLRLRASVKIGFIKLKWLFKAEICDKTEYDQMIRTDFLLPLFAGLREDKTIQDDVEKEDLGSFYEMLKDLKIKPTVEMVQSPEAVFSVDTDVTLTPPEGVASSVNVEIIDHEETKRRELEEQLQASKKKKKRLI